MLFQTILNAFIDFIWPPKCQVCDINLFDEEKILCQSCKVEVVLFSPPFCHNCGLSLFYPHTKSTNSKDLSNSSIFESLQYSNSSDNSRFGVGVNSNDNSPRLCVRCKKEKDNFDKAFVIGSYKGVLREAIHQFKYNKKISLRKYFTEIIDNYIERYDILNEVEIIVPVPLFPTKKRERGFNQAEILANGIGEKWGLPVILNSLYRKRPTEPQSELDYSKRKTNIKNAFEAKNKNLIMDKNVLLIDDIITTHATINECSRILKKEGAAKVFVLALAATERF